MYPGKKEGHPHSATRLLTTAAIYHVVQQPSVFIFVYSLRKVISLFMRREADGPTDAFLRVNDLNFAESR